MEYTEYKKKKKNRCVIRGGENICSSAKKKSNQKHGSNVRSSKGGEGGRSRVVVDLGGKTSWANQKTTLGSKEKGLEGKNMGGRGDSGAKPRIARRSERK